MFSSCFTFPIMKVLILSPGLMWEGPGISWMRGCEFSQLRSVVGQQASFNNRNEAHSVAGMQAAFHFGVLWGAGSGRRCQIHQPLQPVPFHPVPRPVPGNTSVAAGGCQPVSQSVSQVTDQPHHFNTMLQPPALHFWPLTACLHHAQGVYIKWLWKGVCVVRSLKSPVNFEMDNVPVSQLLYLPARCVQLLCVYSERHSLCSPCWKTSDRFE